MEGDRGCCLIIDAALAGAIDLRDADILDRRWWLKLNILTNAFARQTLARLYENKLQQHFALLSSRDEATLEQQWEQIPVARQRLISALMPWADAGATTSRELQEQMREAYHVEFGDPESPEYQQEIDRLLEHWRQQAQDGSAA